MPIFLVQEVNLSPIAVNFVLAGTPLVLALCSVLGSPVSRLLGESRAPSAFQEAATAELMSPQHHSFNAAAALFVDYILGNHFS